MELIHHTERHPKWGQIFLLLFVFLVAGSPANADTPSNSNILMIFSWHQRMPWQMEIENGVGQYYETVPVKPNLFYEYMDAGRFSGEEQLVIFKDYLSQKYGGYRIDHVIFESSPARKLFTSYPKLFQGSRKYLLNPGAINKNVYNDASAVIPVNVDFQRAAKELLKISKGKTIYLVAGTTEPSRKRVKIFFDLFPQLDPAQKVESLAGMPMTALCEKVSHLEPDGIIFYLLIMRDGSGARYIPYDAAARISQSATVPVYTLWTSLLGSGVVGGYLLSGEMVGKQMASVLKTPELVREASINWSHQFHGFFYDWHQLKRWHIDTATLPAQSKILFKEHAFYETYYKEIILFSLAIILLISSVWNRRLKIEINNRITAEQELQISENRFRTLSEATSEGIAITKDGTVIDANKKMSELFRYRVEELMGMSPTDFVVPEYNEAATCQVKNSCDQKYEATGIRKDRSQFPLELLDKKISFNGQEARVVVIRDLTERKQSEEEIKTLQGLLPICSICKKIRDDKGYWTHLEAYICDHSGATFSHSICDECLRDKYPE